MPFVGKIFKHNTNQNFNVVNYENKEGAVSDAAVVYQLRGLHKTRRARRPRHGGEYERDPRVRGQRATA